MQRDLSQLTGRTFDVLVVGGGVYGLTIAYDTAQRGLNVALIDRADFGSASSFNHLRTIHGGLRYLQHLDVARARESIRERRTLAQLAPHTLRRLPFVLPLTRSLVRGKAAMRAGFLLDRAVARDRNRAVPDWLRLPGGRVISAAAAAEQFPGIRTRALTGAAVWHDYVTTEPDRLTISWAIAAAQCGAVLANYVEAIALRQTGSRVSGVGAADRLDGHTFDIAARLTINATGGHVDGLLGSIERDSRTPMLMAMNLVTRREAGDEALGGRSGSGRNLFMVPWRGRALFGTWESSTTVAPDAPVNPHDVTAFLRELNEAFPALDLTPADISLVHRGIVPAAVNANGVALAKREVVTDHVAHGVEGLISVAGSKYTTARGVAERMVNLALRRLGEAPRPCHTAARPLPGGQVRDLAGAIGEARRDYDALLPSDTIPHLVAAYGSRYRDVLAVAADRPDWRTRIAPHSPVVGAQLVWAIRHEMAATLADAVIRRTPLGALGHPGDAALDLAAAIVAAELGWSSERTRAEVQRARAFYGT